MFVIYVLAEREKFVLVQHIALWEVLKPPFPYPERFPSSSSVYNATNLKSQLRLKSISFYPEWYITNLLYKYMLLTSTGNH